MKRPAWMIVPLLVASVILLPTTVAHAQDGGDDPAPQPRDDDEPQDTPRRGFGGGGGPFGGMQRALDGLKDELGLDDEQMQKLADKGDGYRQEMMEAFGRMREEGFPDRETIQKQMEEFRGRVNEDIRGVLTDEQKAKFDKLLEENGGQMPFGGGRGFGDGNGTRERGGEGRNRNRRRGPSKEDRLKRIRDALILSEEEAEVIMPIIEKIIDAQIALQRTVPEQRRELEGFLKSGADEEAITARLADFRNARKAARDTLEGAQGELLELLTLEQEAKCVALGVLD